MAEGGIAAAVGNVDPDDSWRQHFIDTMRSGKFLNNWKMVETFTKEAQTGSTSSSSGARSSTGRRRARSPSAPSAAIPTAACATSATVRARAHKDHAGEGPATDAKVYMETTVTKLFKKEGRVVGALAYTRENGKFVHFKAKAVVMATGGWGRIFKVTSNSWEGRGTALSSATTQGPSWWTWR